MTLINELPLHRLQFYITTSYPCGYLDGRVAQSLIATPHHLIGTQVYSDLVQMGFRRSGKFTYRPHCESCNACIPVRLPIEEFHLNRTQRRTLKQHANLTSTLLNLEFSDEHFALYCTYQQARHSGGSMDAENPEQYRNFLMQSNVESMLVEFREEGVLRMVSIVDCLADGLSAVYTFYDCSDPSASYGTYNVLWLAERCHDQKLPYLYLGYWIRDCRKMAYKSNFKPLEGLLDGHWGSLKTD